MNDPADLITQRDPRKDRESVRLLRDLDADIVRLETVAGERGARAWSGPRTPEAPARKRARKRAKASRKRNR